MRSLLLALLLTALPASAGELDDVARPVTITAGDGSSLVLNGMGLREKWWIDVYVGSLYLTEKTKDANKAITSDTTKRISMKFIYRKVSKEKMVETLLEGLQASPKAAAMTKEVEQLKAMIDQDIFSGDEITLEYVPGKGTTIAFNGKAKGTIGGKDFMEAIWAIYIGPTPVTAELKAGMMGG